MLFKRIIKIVVFFPLWIIGCKKDNQVSINQLNNDNTQVIIDTIAGNGEIDYVDNTGKNARMGYINGMTMDANGIIYISEKPKSGGPAGYGIGIGEIRKIESNGRVTTVFNLNGYDPTMLGNGGFMTMFDNNKILINDYHPNGAQFIKILDPDTKKLTAYCTTGFDIDYWSNFVYIKNSGIIAGFNDNKLNYYGYNTCSRDIKVNSPSLPRNRSIAIDNSQNIYVAISGQNLIYQYTPNGAWNTLVTGIESPSQIFVDKNDNVFFLTTNILYKRLKNGQLIKLITDFTNVPKIKFYLVDNSGSLICSNDGLIFRLRLK